MNQRRILNFTVIVGALGYFVDIYDLVLFGVVRKTSLTSMGIAAVDQLSIGVFLLNMQMFGMLLGGLIWGILGDRRGRVSVLFGSILLYSVANIANGYIVPLSQHFSAIFSPIQLYGWLRLIAGIGLAGELGAAVTLVSEAMTKESRGYGTAIVAGVGLFGAVFANLISRRFDWQMAYIIGGVFGFLLLILRISLLESNMFAHMKTKTDIRRGDFFMLFRSRERLLKYISCILIGVPIWFVVGVLVTFSPEIMKELGVADPINAGNAIMYTYIGLVFGDLASGFLSQWIKSRKKVVFGFILLTIASSIFDLFSHDLSPEDFYHLCLVLGFATGYWAVFVTIGSEQFGTNLRATVTTTVPNFVRGSVVPLTFSFKYLSVHMGLVPAALTVGAVVFTIAVVALFQLKETYGKDLDYVELERNATSTC